MEFVYTDRIIINIILLVLLLSELIIEQLSKEVNNGKTKESSRHQNW